MPEKLHTVFVDIKGKQHRIDADTLAEVFIEIMRLIMENNVNMGSGRYLTLKSKGGEYGKFSKNNTTGQYIWTDHWTKEKFVVDQVTGKTTPVKPKSKKEDPDIHN